MFPITVSSVSVWSNHNGAQLAREELAVDKELRGSAVVDPRSFPHDRSADLPAHKGTDLQNSVAPALKL